MRTILRHRGIGGLLFAQTQVAFNDNATKLILIGLVQMLLPPGTAGLIVSVIALLLVAPFVLFAPLSGWVADRYQRKQVLSASLWMQLAVMLVLIAAAAFQSLGTAIGGFFLLGAQSALMSPARRGMVKDLAGDSVGEVVGWMEMLCIAAILAGSLAGGQLIDGLAAAAGQPWTAAAGSFVLLAATCAGSLAAFRRVPAHPASHHLPFDRSVVFGHVRLLNELRSDRTIWRAAVGDSVFYFAGGILLLTLAEAGRALFPDGLGAARSTGLMMAAMGAGLALGSIVAAHFSRRHGILGLVPFGALGMAGTLLLLAVLSPGTALFGIALAGLGFCGGLYIVPLGTLLVDRAPEPRRGTILAGSGMLSSLAGVAAVGVHFLVRNILGLGVSGQLVLLALVFLAAAWLGLRLLAPDVVRFAALALARMRYSVRIQGASRVPAAGGALIVCNHVSYVDTVILSLACSRPIRFVSYEGFFSTPVLGQILRLFGTIPVSSIRARDAIVKASDGIRRGELVCIFPEGQLTRTGSLMALKPGFELIARRAECPVIVAHLDGLWGSIASFDGGRYFSKWPKGLRRRTTVGFAAPLGFAEASAARVREVLLGLGEAAFRARTSRPRLGPLLVRALDAAPFRTAVIDPSSPRKTIEAGELLALSWMLSRRWRALEGRRVGVILPPGIAGSAANLALILAGKTPVNLNPLMSPAAGSACRMLAGVRSVVTSRAIPTRLPSVPGEERTVCIEDEISSIPGPRLTSAWILCILAPTRILQRVIAFPPPTDDEESVVLFTSGTSGLPKGVSLTGQNLVANLQQVAETGLLRRDDRVLSALPLFHSFGLTIGLLFPLLTRKTLITAPSPLDCDAITEAARSGNPTVLLATPTFLRTYVRRIPRDAFGTLRLVATGAERLAEETAAAFRGRFGCEVHEGYGLTEASPAVAFNLPNPACGPAADTVQNGWRAGSVGRLLPGIAARLLDPGTGRCEPGAVRGLLLLRGPNIISGYLGDADAEKFREGWLVTGDIARIDEEGFVHLEGRVSRFSKIGGEMVSHAAVEDAIRRAFPAGAADGSDCVLGRPDAEKGEELVLLTTRAITRDDLRGRLDLPNLWIPRVIIPVEQLPLLPTGKLDLAACRLLADDRPTKS